MNYRVIYSEAFVRCITSHVEYLCEQGAAPEVIADWYDRLFTRLDLLGAFPSRCPVDSFETRRTGRETRKLNFGDYIVLYEVDRKESRVDIAVFIHGATRRDV